MFHRITPRLLPACLAIALFLGAGAAHAQCAPGHLAYLDLAYGAAVVIGPEFPAQPPVFVASSHTECGPAFKTVLKVTVPQGCHGVEVWLDYASEPHDWTLNIGDSATNNGYGGDAGTLPAGQNAEVQILNQQLTVYSAADNPADVDAIVSESLALTQGALRFEVGDQSLAWGQPLTALETPDLHRLFFLPSTPVAPENRDIYIGLNRTIASPGRDGCGLRRAMVMFD